MHTYSEQVTLISSWISEKGKWTRIQTTSGEKNPGSSGQNIIIGYLPTCNGNKNEITVIYKCSLSIVNDKNVENHQLSSLSFSDWIEFMKIINN